MFSEGRFRLRVDAALGSNNSPLYALAIQCSSITAALYSLSETLSMRMDDGTLKGGEIAAELVQILCPIADEAEILPAGAEWAADATLEVRIVEESDADHGEVDVVQLDISVHSHRRIPEVIGDPCFEERFTRGGRAIEAAIADAALLEEWNSLCELDGFVGKANELFGKVCKFFESGAALAKWALFVSTAQRAEDALLSLYVTHDARKPLQRLTTSVTRIYEAERRYQQRINTRNRLKELQ